MADLPTGGPCKHPPLPNKPGTNWVEKTGGLPHMIDCVARAIYHTGRSKGDVSKAVQLAVGAVQNWADGQGDVHPTTRARAAAAVAEFHAKAKASKAMTAAKNLSDCGCGGETIDLATAVTTARSSQPVRMNGLYSIAATVKRLKKNPKLKNLDDASLQRIAAARILRRQIRNRLGITDLKKMAPGQVKALEKAGLVGGGKSPVGTIVSYTLQRGPRKGQTISVRRTASGWHEVKPPKAVSVKTR